MRSTLVCAVLAQLIVGSIAAAEPPSTPRYYYPVPVANAPQTIETDVCVYGATPGGIMAAIQARRMGKSAALVEFGRHVGGMTSSGLSKTDGGKSAAGISREFYKVVGSRDFSPAAAEAQFLKMLEADGVRLFREHRLKRVEICTAMGIALIEMENGIAFAKISSMRRMKEICRLDGRSALHVGRETNATFGETS